MQATQWKPRAKYGDLAELNWLLSVSGGLTVLMFLMYTLSAHAQGIFGGRSFGLALLTPIVLIVVPIMLPLVQKLGIDLVWFCTLVAVCLQTAWLSPPVALSAYFLKGVVPDWDLADIYAGMMQFMVLQVIGLLLLLAFPQLALWLPAVLRD